MREGYWCVGTVESGAVGEKTKFWVDGARPDHRSRRKEQSALKKAKQNEYSSLKELARLVNANFTAGDLLLGLDYSPEGMEKLLRRCGLDSSAAPQNDMRGSAARDGTEERISPLASLGRNDRDEGAEGGQVARVTVGDQAATGWGGQIARAADALREAADRELVNCLRRVKRMLEKDGIELYYIAITSDMDGDTGEQVRVHHHLLVPMGTEQAFVEKWEKLGWGGVSWTPLWANQTDRTPIAEYLLRQVRRVPDANKYKSSRNLIRPKARVRAVPTGSLLRAPRGCTLLHINEYKPGQAQYMAYLLPEAEIAAAEEQKRRRREKLVGRGLSDSSLRSE